VIQQVGSDLKLKAGDWVEVKSKGEILATLDENGQLDSLPFMPEMLEFAGKRLRVVKRAHKTCDTVFPGRGRRVADAVHLETRCDGKAHGGCEAGCLIFWKVDWLKPAGETSASNEGPIEAAGGRWGRGCSEEDLLRATRVQNDAKDTDPEYVCQATRLPYFTTDLNPYDLSQYLEDYSSGNVGLIQLVAGLTFAGYRQLVDLGVGLGRPLRWLYDAWKGLWNGVPYPVRAGKLPRGAKTPTANLGLQPGELVRVKTFDEILETCDETLTNRGMRFDKEMVPFCGGSYRVTRRVTQIINEKTGKMTQMKNPGIILDGVYCQSRYSECRLFCPRGIFSYWREIWLERTADTRHIATD
jgi:hypothetical protein